MAEEQAAALVVVEVRTSTPRSLIGTCHPIQNYIYETDLGNPERKIFRIYLVGDLTDYTTSS